MATLLMGCICIALASHTMQQETCNAPLDQDVHAEHGEALLQVHQSTKLDKLSLDIEHYNAQQPLTDDGFKAVAQQCCFSVTEDFFKKVIDDIGFEICDMGCFNGFMPFFHCDPSQTLANFTNHVAQNSKEHCACFAAKGQCPPFPEDCRTHGTFNAAFHRRRICKSTTANLATTTEAATTTEKATTTTAAATTTITTTTTTITTTTATTATTTTTTLTTTTTATTTTTITTTTATTTTTTLTTTTTTTTPKCCASIWQTPQRTRTAAVAAARKSLRKTTTGAIKVEKWNCVAHPQPIQILTDPATVDATNVSTLDVRTGDYNLLFQIPISATSPAMRKFVNSAAINPVDNISYATVPINNVNYIVRFDDKNTLAFVAQLPHRGDFSGSYAADGFFVGAFDWAGTFYIGADATIIALKDVAQYEGFASQTDPSLTVLTNMSSSKLSYVKFPGGIADAVVAEGDFDNSGDPTAEWIFGLRGNFKLTLAKLPADSNVTNMKSYELTASSDPAGMTKPTSFGAGWNYQNSIFYARNNGDGVFEVVTSSIDLTAKTYTLKQVGKSRATNNNDGMNCMEVANPWSQNCTKAEVEVPHVNGTCPAGSREVWPLL